MLPAALCHLRGCILPRCHKVLLLPATFDRTPPVPPPPHRPPPPPSPCPHRRYTERLVISRPVTIATAPGADVEVSWTTREPYQSVVEVDSALGEGLEGAGAVRLRGLRLRHSSPSVANNYAVRLVVSTGRGCGQRGRGHHSVLVRDWPQRGQGWVLEVAKRPASPTQPAPGLVHPAHQGCGAVLEGCDISSSTGDGVGVEGGAPALLRCTVHDCQRHGARALWMGCTRLDACLLLSACCCAALAHHLVLTP